MSRIGWAGVGALLVAAVASGCTDEQPQTAAGQSTTTVPLHVLARRMETYRGRVVRTCGDRLSPVTEANGSVRSWELRKDDPNERRFATFVMLPSCGGRAPALQDGCVTGRIAREDGSLTDPGFISVTSHLIGSSEWWLHPQCPADAAEQN